MNINGSGAFSQEVGGAGRFLKQPEEVITMKRNLFGLALLSLLALLLATRQNIGNAGVAISSAEPPGTTARVTSSSDTAVTYTTDTFNLLGRREVTKSFRLEVEREATAPVAVPSATGAVLRVTGTWATAQINGGEGFGPLQLKVTLKSPGGAVSAEGKGYSQCPRTYPQCPTAELSPKLSLERRLTESEIREIDWTKKWRLVVKNENNDVVFNIKLEVSLKRDVLSH